MPIPSCDGEVESLLAQDSNGKILDYPAVDLLDAVGGPNGTRKLGPYEILEPIGAGGMGRVFKARDTRLNRYVAIKISRAQFSERFEREARAVAALNHPQICAFTMLGRVTW
jgi:serine/threonine protein kinase